MTEVPIPAPSLERLRASYKQFEQLCVVIAEAMGLPPGTVKRVELADGTFLVDVLDESEVTVNGRVTEDVVSG